MILENLLNQLESDKAKTRTQAAQVIGTLDEVVALPALAARFRQETDSHVQAALKWAGRRLKAADDAGYSTLEAIISHFNVAAEWAIPTQSQDEQAKLRQIQHDAAMRALEQQRAAAPKQALGRLAKGYMLGLPGLLMSGPMVPDLASDTVDAAFSHRLPVEQQRKMPIRPGDSDPSMLVRRMMHAVDLNDCVKAAQNLARDVNNPAALPALAQVFVEDSKAPVREAAQAAAKRIYWNAVYWEMEQDGSMAVEIERRRSDVDTQSPSDTTANAESDPNDIADILRKAEEKRRQRKR